MARQRKQPTAEGAVEYIASLAEPEQVRLLSMLYERPGLPLTRAIQGLNASANAQKRRVSAIAADLHSRLSRPGPRHTPRTVARNQEIVRLHRSEERTLGELGDDFHLSRRQIARIVAQADYWLSLPAVKK